MRTVAAQPSLDDLLSTSCLLFTGAKHLGQVFGNLTNVSPNCLDGPPTLAAQRAVVRVLADQLEPLRRAHKLADYVLEPGTRLRRLWGRCQHFGDGRSPLITIRCTAENDRQRWRRPAAITATLLHELVHLRYRGHGPRFWALLRLLLDEAATAGVYRPLEDDPTEHGRGDEKLAGSAADAVALAARQRRRERAALNRSAARQWQAGQEARIALARGPLAGARVRILEVARGWLTVVASSGRRYRVAASVLVHPAEAAESASA